MFDVWRLIWMSYRVRYMSRYANEFSQLRDDSDYEWEFEDYRERDTRSS